MDTEYIRSKILVILGSTATGKTDLAIKLAKKFNGEIISCDSRQVYKGLDIGTGKLPGGKVQVIKYAGWWEIDGIKVWMYDVADLKQQYTVADYVKDAEKKINEILKKGKLPVVVGGTGLYLKALLYGMSNLEIPVDKKLREQLNELNLEQLQKKLQELNKEGWNKLNISDRQNPRRLIRHTELYLMRQQNKSQKIEHKNQNYDILKIGLKVPREILYEKINDRAVDWIKYGIVDEVKKIISREIAKKRIKDLGLEYAVILEFLEKKISPGQMLEKMQNKVRQYAKRQITWFQKEKDIFWFDITNENFTIELEKTVRKWYDSRVYATKNRHFP